MADIWQKCASDRKRPCLDLTLVCGRRSHDWICHAVVPPPVRVQAPWRSKAKGFLPSDAKCPNAVSACLRVFQVRRRINSALMGLKKVRKIRAQSGGVFSRRKTAALKLLYPRNGQRVRNLSLTSHDLMRSSPDEHDRRMTGDLVGRQICKGPERRFQSVQGAARVGEDQDV